MYNKQVIDRLIKLIQTNNGINDKNRLADIVQKEFSLKKDRTVYYGDDFAIRFSKSEKRQVGNTVLSLSALQKYDHVPFIVCIVASTTNYMLLANTTFLKKISHSSQQLRIDNIKGSFNGSDIMLEFEGFQNAPPFFERLFAYHCQLSFEDNLERLVESTNEIMGRVKKFHVTPAKEASILNSVGRADAFIKSEEYQDLKNDLDTRIAEVGSVIASAAAINNVNVRGRAIEYLIAENDSPLKDQLIDALKDDKNLPQFKTEDKLGDYSKSYPSFDTETDIKSKIMSLDSNPKAYNIDKLLEFLAAEKSVYMIYLVGIGERGEIITRLCSVFDSRLIKATMAQPHWAGRNSRGVAQFLGTALTRILVQPDASEIDHETATAFLQDLINT